MLNIHHISHDRGMSWYDERAESDSLARLIVITYGKCLYWINGEKRIAEKGDFLFIPPETPYYGKSVPTVFHEKLVFALSVHEQDDTFPLILRSGDAAQTKAGCYDLCVEKLRAAWKEWEDGMPYANIRAAAAVMETIALWCRELERGEQSDVSLLHVDNMKAYIQNHYREKITKHHLGASIGRSPNHAASLFRRVTGQPISHYVHSVRMRTAAYMLTESLLTVAEISEYLGYSDVSYFQRVFKRSFGYPPSHYLKDRPLQL